MGNTVKIRVARKKSDPTICHFYTSFGSEADDFAQIANPTKSYWQYHVAARPELFGDLSDLEIETLEERTYNKGDDLVTPREEWRRRDLSNGSSASPQDVPAPPQSEAPTPVVDPPLGD